GASRSEQRTHNPSVAGSSPAWATRHGDRVRHRRSLPVGLAASPPAWDDEGSEPVTQGALMTPDDALTAYVRRHAANALEHLVCVEGAVHEVRTSLRRLRAAQLLLAPQVPLPVTAEGDLRFTARALSAVRDTDVLAETLLAEAEDLPAEPVRAAAREELSAALAARREDGVAQVRRSRSDPRWQRTLDLLRAWREHPPTEAVGRPLHVLAEARREVLGRLRSAGGDPAALNSARKAAKRWRYASELLLPAEPG